VSDAGRSRVGVRLRRGAFLLPSAFTVGNLFLGFWAVIAALDGRFVLAGVAVLAAGVLDNLDGRIARMTGTESEFGREFDSLADVVTFGVAPALAAHLWGLRELDRSGWLVPLFYLVATATRLARFNVQVARTDTRWFVGLPAPAAAGTVAVFLLLDPDPDWRPWLIGLVTGGLLGLGVLMVSTFRYWSFKSLDLARPRSYRVALPIAAAALLLALRPKAFLPVIAIVYALSGPFGWLVGRWRHRQPGRPHSGEAP
jgi:CDP-diacylglycerol--serine O-phosphatidyltransferase